MCDRLLEICTDAELHILHQLPRLGCDYTLVGSAVVVSNFEDIDIVVLLPNSPKDSARAITWLQEQCATESLDVDTDTYDTSVLEYFRNCRVVGTRLNLLVTHSPIFYKRWTMAAKFSAQLPTLFQTRENRVRLYQIVVGGTRIFSGWTHAED